MSKYGLKDETGNRYSHLLVIERAPNQGTRAMWKCLCDCGNTVIVRGAALRNGQQKSCGCGIQFLSDLKGKKIDKLTVLQYNTITKKWICECECGEIVERSTQILNKDNRHMCDLCLKEKNRLNISIGDKYGKWTVLHMGEKKEYTRSIFYTCQCECGTIRDVRASALFHGMSSSCGCVKSKGEEKIYNFLKEKSIKFNQEHIFPDCVYIRPLRFDFFLYELNICIEFDGRQHYGVNNDWHSDWSNTEIIQARDEIKNNYCKNNNIRLIRISYLDITKVEEILTKELCIHTEA